MIALPWLIPENKAPMTKRKPAVDDQVPDEPAGPSRLTQFRYNYAKHDPAQCTVKGLFQPLKRNTRKERKHTVHHKYGDVTLEFECSEPLGADDLRVLQGLLALGSPIADPEVLNASTPPESQKLRDSLNLSESANHLETLVVQATLYQLAKEIGLTLNSGGTFNRIRASIKRMCAVHIVATDKDGRRTGYNLIGGYSSEEKESMIRIALNPRLTTAILGERVAAKGSHTRIEMAEVRAIRGVGADATRILHQYLSALTPPGTQREFIATTLSSQIWPQSPPPKKAKPEDKHRYQARLAKQNQRLRVVMARLGDIGWHNEQIVDSRANSAQPAYRKWVISRPAVLDVDEVRSISQSPPPLEKPHPLETPTDPAPTEPEPPDLATLVRKSPAKALQEAGDQLTDEQFGTCIAKQPVAAIKHCLGRLTDEQFATCADKKPDAAMRYALDRLTPDQLHAAALKDPQAALEFALVRLTDQTFVACAKTIGWPVGNQQVTETQLDAWFATDPESAARHLESKLGKTLPTFRDIMPLLSPVRLASYALAWPIDALENTDLIPASLITEIARAQPAAAIEYAADKMDPELLAECILVAPAAAIRYRFSSLDPDERAWCLKKSPWTAIALMFKQLTPDEVSTTRSAMSAAMPKQIDRIIAECPEAAFHHLRRYLTRQQLQHCEYALFGRLL